MNVGVLLEPVAGDDPCGDDLSFSREFDAIRESRRADDPTLAQGEWKKPLKAADWPGVALQCEALLRRRGKDLRVAVWWADAQSRTRGVVGLADGLLLCARLCETWWDAGLHPRPDDGDPAPRVGSLDWLLGQVVAAAQSLPGDASTPADAPPAPAGRPRAAEAAALSDALAALERLQAVVDARLGPNAPSFGAARKALEDARLRVQPAAPHQGGPVDARSPPTGADPAPSGPLQSRAEALQQLRAVADFFRRTEPHSPVGYLADKAAAWGEMPLHDWLRAVLKDPGSLAQIEELLGVPRAPE